VAVFQETVSEWSNDNAPRLGASLAFYTLLSLAPLLVIVVAVAALVYGQEAARGQLVREVQGLVGIDGAQAIQGLVQGAYKPGTGIVATALGMLTLFLGASSVMVELRAALNTIWRAPAANGRSRFACLLGIVRARCYSFALILGIGFLLLVTLVLNAWIAAMGSVLGPSLPTAEPVLELATFGVSFFVFALLFATTYKMLPDVHLKWTDVAIGACVTSLFFTIGRQLIALYLGKASFRSVYGAAGSLVIVLVWVYYSAQLFFLGAEFTKVYTKMFGSESANGLNPIHSRSVSVIVEPVNKGIVHTEAKVKGRGSSGPQSGNK
jgi:membrane protein